MFIERHETMLKYGHLIDTDIHLTDIVSSFTEPPYHWLSNNPHMFIDSRYMELLVKAYEAADEYNERHGCDYTYSQKLTRPIAVIPDGNWGETSINYLRKTNPYADEDWYVQKFREYMDLFENFKQYVKNRKIETDSIL